MRQILRERILRYLVSRFAIQNAASKRVELDPPSMGSVLEKQDDGRYLMRWYNGTRQYQHDGFIPPEVAEERFSSVSGHC